MIREAILTSIVASVSLAGASALAEEPPPQTSVQRSSDVKLDETEIQGELEKPKIFFILPKAEREAATKRERIRFYPDILEPLDKERFEEEARILYRHGIPAD